MCIFSEPAFIWGGLWLVIVTITAVTSGNDQGPANIHLQIGPELEFRLPIWVLDAAGRFVTLRVEIYVDSPMPD